MGIRVFLVDYSWPLCANVTSSIKPEVHNISQLRQRRTEPRPLITCTEKLVNIGPLDVCKFRRYLRRTWVGSIHGLGWVAFSTTCDGLCWVGLSEDPRPSLGDMPADRQTDRQTQTYSSQFTILHSPTGSGVTGTGRRSC